MLSKEESRRIRDDIRRALMRDWDPIGINDEPACADEYDSYIGEIYSILTTGGSDDQIKNHLRWVATDGMELQPDEKAIARTVKALREIGIPPSPAS